MNEIKVGDGPRPAAHARKLLVWGVALSVGYLGILLFYAVGVWPLMRAMTPDEFAEFLSGAFAPLAFLWLVLGFKQQGDELQNSARALWLQGEELRNSVEQQRALVEVSKEQLQSEIEARRLAMEEDVRNAQPRLQLSSGGGSYSGERSKLKLRLHSGGPVCTDLRATLTGQPNRAVPILAEGETVEWTVIFERGIDATPLDLTVDYTDLKSIRRRRRFHIPIQVEETSGHVTFGLPARFDLEEPSDEPAD